VIGVEIPVDENDPHGEKNAECRMQNAKMNEESRMKKSPAFCLLPSAFCLS
jgi:hypothetical protein